MTIVLIIVNYNSGDALRKCLSAVSEQTLAPDRILVVDNASEDRSLECDEVRSERVEVLRMERNVGFAAANNAALERCAGADWVALLNPDAFPEPRWLEALASAAGEARQAGSFASCLLDARKPGVLDGMGDAYHVSGLVWRQGHGKPEPEQQIRREVFSACAAAALYRYAAVIEVNGFDEHYFCYNEDIDLGFRLRLNGAPCWYVPEARVHHVGSAVTGKHSYFTLFHGHRNLVWTYVKNMPGSLLRRYLWEHLLLNLFSIMALSLKYRTTAIVSAKLSAIRGLPRVLRQRRMVQSTRTVTDSELLAVMVRGWWRAYLRESPH